MKILQLIQRPQLRGAEIFACQLSKELTGKGHESIIVTLFSGEAELPFEGKVIHLGLSKKNRFIDWGAWKKLADLIEKEKPDVLQANAGDTIKYAVISKLFFRWRTPIIFRNASMVSLYINNPLKRLWNAYLYSLTDYVISVSRHTRNDFVSVFPHAKKKIEVIPIGIETGKFIKPENANSDTRVILHIGGFTFEKNHFGLVRIVEQVIKNHPDVKVWLVGDGPLRAEVEQYIKSKALTNHVKFWGYQNNPLEFFREATVFILPSVIEGLPAVILESFYAKVPVVAYNVGGISELIIDRQTGYLIEQKNEMEFARRIEEVLQTSSELLKCTTHAYQMVTENYTIEKIARRFADTYSVVKNNIS